MLVYINKDYDVCTEVEGAKEALETYKDDIIFSIGHTVATYEEAVEAVERGAKHVTHLYNAATPFQHREPGVFGAAWLNDAQIPK